MAVLTQHDLADYAEIGLADFIETALNIDPAQRADLYPVVIGLVAGLADARSRGTYLADLLRMAS